MPVNFIVWTRVEHPARGRFLAVASALPDGVSQRCGPEERSEPCKSRKLADLACHELASTLAASIHARGNEVSEMEPTPRVRKVRARLPASRT